MDIKGQKNLDFNNELEEQKKLVKLFDSGNIDNMILGLKLLNNKKYSKQLIDIKLTNSPIFIKYTFSSLVRNCAHSLFIYNNYYSKHLDELDFKSNSDFIINNLELIRNYLNYSYNETNK